MAQADPASWPRTIDELEAQVRLGQGGEAAKFKLGTLYYYDAKVTYLTRSNIAAAPELSRAQELLSPSWHRLKVPVVGLVYAEASQMPSPNLKPETEVLDELIKRTAGRRAYSSYEVAGLNDWQDAPPPAGLVPPNNLKPLRGVLKEAWSFSGIRFGHGVMHGNTIEAISDPIPPDRQRKVDYLAKWRAVVDQALPSAPST